MLVKDITAEDFLNYKAPSMFIASAYCDWKCCREQNLPLETCQNTVLARSPSREIPDPTILKLFEENDITKAVVIGGLEPFDQFDELIRLVRTFREAGERCQFVIYTGYNRDEIEAEITKLAELKNIIVKFGRYVPNQEPRYDEVLGVTLASPNQYAEVIG